MSTILYQPLNQSKQEIRLIVIEDTSTAGNGSNIATPPLKCQLITTSLNLYQERIGNYVAHGVNKLRNSFVRRGQPYSRDFYALSYVWGDPAAVCDIAINGTTTKIGANLYAALQSIQRNTKFRVIWADALCINQRDNAEKSWQVQQMDAIYSRARATISWFGLGSDNSDLALKALVALDDDLFGDDWSVQLAEAPETVGNLVKDKVLRVVKDKSQWNAIENLCARAYWSRIWIFQEMAGARETYFLCGDSVARDLHRPIAHLLAWQADGFELHGEPLSPYCLSMINAVQKYRNPGGFDKRPVGVRPGAPLLQMLMGLSTLNATEARDMIYAPLSVATNRDKLGIVADYSKDLDIIFLETTCALLRNGDLEVLVLTSLHDRALRLPSWVPDWSAQCHKIPARQYGADRGHHQRASTLKAIPQLSDHITLDGYVLGRISRIYDECPASALKSLDGQSDDATIGTWFSQIEADVFPMERGESIDRKYTENEEKENASALVPLLSAVNERDSYISSPLPPDLDMYRALKSAKTMESLMLDLRQDENVKRSRQRFPNLLEYDVKRIQEVLETGARPYRTDSECLGITLRHKERRGDVVVVIPDVSMPCVLRRHRTEGPSATTEASNERYKFVGVTYIRGVMGGEALKERYRPELRTFTLY